MLAVARLVCAGVVEQADTTASKAVGGNPLRVQVPPPAPTRLIPKQVGVPSFPLKRAASQPRLRVGRLEAAKVRGAMDGGAES